jgi:hypothetical protein
MRGMMYMLDLNDFTITDAKGPEYERCGCSNCGWKGNVADCETEWEQDGWESPSYMVHLCPKCIDGGCIDDYWPSEHIRLLKDGEPCDHPGCQNHISHPCEKCGRIAAKGDIFE